MSLHTWGHQGPCKASLPSHSTVRGAELPQAKKSLAPMRAGSLRLCPTLRPCGRWPARLLYLGWGSPGKNAGVYRPILVAIPSGALYFLLP